MRARSSPNAWTMLRFSGEREIFSARRRTHARTPARTPAIHTHNPTFLYWFLTVFFFGLFPISFFFLLYVFSFFVGNALGVHRFLRARKFDVLKAKAMLLSAEQWRKDENIDELAR